MCDVVHFFFQFPNEYTWQIVLSFLFDIDCIQREKQVTLSPLCPGSPGLPDTPLQSEHEKIIERCCKFCVAITTFLQKAPLITIIIFF